MPLVSAPLASSLADIARNPPATAAQCAKAWADAVQSYSGGVIPASTTVADACATLAGALSSAFAAPAAAPAMEAAFAAFAVTVAGGMAGAGFAGVPPAGPVGFAQQFASSKPETHQAAGNALATLIDTWLKTGTATLIAPPNTLVPWS